MVFVLDFYGRKHFMISIANNVLKKGFLNDFLAECKKYCDGKNMLWSDKHVKLIQEWFLSDHVYDFSRLEIFIIDLNKQLLHLSTKKESVLSPETLKKAKTLQKVYELGDKFSPSDQQESEQFPGINKIPKEELLPLDFSYTQQQDRWQQTTSGHRIKLKSDSNGPETSIYAFGDPDNPSMVYMREDIQIGHRYQGTKKRKEAPASDGSGNTETIKLAENHSKNRTYGSKKKLTGKVYKVKGMVDGHSIQAQNDQYNLDKSSPYPTADTHPANMYWENQSYGKHVRQGTFESEAFEQEKSFLHVNVYNDIHNPTKYEASNGQEYVAPDTVFNHYDGQTYSFNNSRDANYSNIAHLKIHYTYDDSQTYKKGQNKNLGGLKASAHLALNERDKSAFPFAQVIDQQDEDFTKDPVFNTNPTDKATEEFVDRYMNKHIDKKLKSGTHFEGEHLSNSQNPDEENFITQINDFDAQTRTYTGNTAAFRELNEKRFKQHVVNNGRWSKLADFSKTYENLHEKFIGKNYQYNNQTITKDLLVEKIEDFTRIDNFLKTYDSNSANEKELADNIEDGNIDLKQAAEEIHKIKAGADRSDKQNIEKPTKKNTETEAPTPKLK